MQSTPFPRAVLVTGATGNLGRKMIEALARVPGCERIVGLDLNTAQVAFSTTAQARLTLLQADLADANGSWRGALAGIEAVVHFAAASPLPDSSWQDALASCDMTLNLLQAAVEHGVRRLVFASSNHAMGAYKDEPYAAGLGPGMLTTELSPAPGTRWFDGAREVHSLAYGSSKITCEKLCSAIAQATAGTLSCVSIRVGWVLPGANDPADITHSGAPGSKAGQDHLDSSAERALRWFRGMWLSNRDFEALFLAALGASAAHWPASHVIINGVSANYGTVWDLSGARAWLGYQPVDDVYQGLNPTG
ncbi:NAD-dependent epimerase/dehydratase family protein [Pseudomonas japonica]|uniref:NAD-dependent epimerase/dehydratase family protein n=1 Tax=Pseudomonas japonica TaxID=256466 RepID=UPI0015E2C8DE|nr:NAD(P)-dependent oxidoreductase [Pseudomonas japonica]MBA1243767.1 NAD(P)-dependent oxidoreductase [Pseudomonas japonica]